MRHRAARRRPAARLALLGVAAVLALTAAPAAVSVAAEATGASAPAHRAARVAATSRPTAPVRVAASPGPTRATTVLHGWHGREHGLVAGAVLHLHVRITGAQRLLRLERRLHHRWRVVAHARSGSDGRAELAWRAPRAHGHVVLRIDVAHTTRYRATTTRSRVLPVHPTPTTSSAPTASPAPTAPTPTSAPAPGPSASATPTVAPIDAAESLRQQLLVLVNQARAPARSCGSTSYPAAPPLARSDALDRAAGDYAAQMASRDFFSHEGPDGSTVETRLRAVGIRNVTMRENIAAGQTSAASVMQSWLDSPDHCANLMAADVTRIGLGHAADAHSTYHEYWVQDLAG